MKNTAWDFSANLVHHISRQKYNGKVTDNQHLSEIVCSPFLHDFWSNVDNEEIYRQPKKRQLAKEWRPMASLLSLDLK